MSPTDENDSEALWDMEELLKEAEEEVDEKNDRNTSDSEEQDQNTQNESSPVWEMEELLEDTEAETDGSSKNRYSTGSNDQRPSNRTGLITSLSVFLVLGIGVYLIASYNSNPPSRTANNAVQTRTESDLKDWLNNMNKIETSLSKSDLSIRSETLLSFSSEMQQKDELESLVKYTIDGNFSTFKSTTRDIGAVLQLLESNANMNSSSSDSNSPIDQNKEVVQSYKEDIKTAWSDIRSQENDSDSSSASPDRSSDPGATRAEDDDPQLK